MKKFFIVTLLLIIGATAAWSQNIGWDDFAEEFLQDAEDSDKETFSVYDELLELHRNPININSATRADLLRMPFLNEVQADSILVLRNHYGQLLSMGELQLVRNLHHKERAYMTLFFYCPDELYKHQALPDSLRKSGSGRRFATEKEGLSTEISATLGIPLYKREGFKSLPAEELAKNPNKQYLGNNLSTTLRYRASLDNRLFWGLTAQKDEGEPFASRGNTLYDSYNFYLAGRGRGALQQWVVGDFRAHFGLGLTVGASSGDAMNVLSSYRPRQSGFVRHTSTDEATYLRGGAITLKLSNVTLMAFASWRELDATLSKDSISTILTNGYHRTQLEMSKKHNVQALQGGFSACFDAGAWTIGINATHTHYNKPYRRPTSLYRTYYFEGQNFGNYSLSYSWKHDALSLWGETATSLQGGVATIHRVQFAPKRGLNLYLLHRYYSTHYLSATAQSYKIGSRVQNEHGALVGANYNVNEFWRLTAYVDYAHYPFAVYTSDHPSNAVTAQWQSEYTPNRNTAFLVRYKYRVRPQDNRLDELDYKHQHIFKLQARYTIGPVAMTSTADLVLMAQPDKDNTSGWMLSQKASATLWRSTKVNLAAAFFHTDSYSEALRLYEQALLYSTSYPSCYYHGQRLSASLVQRLGSLSLAMKYSLTHYTNRDVIGSGLRAYKGSSLHDIMLQGVLKF